MFLKFIWGWFGRLYVRKEIRKAYFLRDVVMGFQSLSSVKTNDRFYRYRLILGVILVALLVLNESVCRI